MPLANRKAYLAYMNAYQHRIYHSRRKAAIAKLGSRCKQCGITTGLHFVQAVPFKVVSIAPILKQSQIRYEKAIVSLTLMCDTCSSLWVRVWYDDTAHGTLTSYRYCRCEACKAAKTTYMRGWQRRNRLKQMVEVAYEYHEET